MQHVHDFLSQTVRDGKDHKKAILAMWRLEINSFGEK